MLKSGIWFLARLWNAPFTFTLKPWSPPTWLNAMRASIFALSSEPLPEKAAATVWSAFRFPDVSATCWVTPLPEESSLASRAF